MCLNRILLSADEVAQDEGGDREARIPEEDERAKHIRVRVAVEGVGVCDATLKTTSAAIALHLNEIEQPPLPLPQITLVLALPRPRAARRAVRNAAQLGVQRILFVGASRVERQSTRRFPRSRWNRAYGN